MERSLETPIFNLTLLMVSACSGLKQKGTLIASLHNKMATVIFLHLPSHRLSPALSPPLSVLLWAPSFLKCHPNGQEYKNRYASYRDILCIWFHKLFCRRLLS